MATLLTMPPEMQLMIANRVEEKDVLTLNSTCRALRSLVKPVMALIFGSVRTYHLSEEGMASLLELSKDTTSAPYLRTLIIVHDGTVPPLSLFKTLSEALEHFSIVSKNLTTVGARRSSRQNTPGAHTIAADFHIQAFAGQLLATAKRAKLLVSSLVFELEVPADIIDWSGLQRRAWTHPSPVQGDFTEEVEVASAIAEGFDTLSCADIGRGFKFALIGQEGTRRSPSVIYDPVKQSLDAVHLEADDWKVVLQWLPRSTKLKVVKLFDCNVEFRAFDNLITVSSLESLSVKDVTLVQNRDMTENWHFVNPSTLNVLLQDWRAVFAGLLARSPNLSSCRLGQLSFHYTNQTGVTWETHGTENVKKLLRDLKWKKCSRLAFKKANSVYSEPRKPRKKSFKHKKLRCTHKKATKSKN
ncbi:hypothetical protein M436DRAFT_78161 [Aureobasidium namibiae CBS 147.97]|uniref:F-box domain-containing protein n=1 Tax=Aureobasidium namibiae CBS 147.97 TaxID=1043004 RepID=A0A074XP94_9PEZI